MKKILKKLKGTDPDRGYIFLKGTILAHGYQQHIFFAFLGSITLFFLSLEFTDFSDVVTAIFTALIAYAVAWIIEGTHAIKPHRTYDPWDAHLTFMASLLACMLCVIGRAIFYHPHF